MKRNSKETNMPPLGTNVLSTAAGPGCLPIVSALVYSVSTLILAEVEGRPNLHKYLSLKYNVNNFLI